MKDKIQFIFNNNRHYILIHFYKFEIVIWK